MREREKSFRKVEIERVIWNGKVGKPTNWVRKEPAADGRGTEDRDGREEPMRPESDGTDVWRSHSETHSSYANLKQILKGASIKKLQLFILS